MAEFTYDTIEDVLEAESRVYGSQPVSRPAIRQRVRDELETTVRRHSLGNRVPLETVSIQTRDDNYETYMRVWPVGTTVLHLDDDDGRVHVTDQPDQYVLVVGSEGMEASAPVQRVLARHELAHVYQLHQWQTTSEYGERFTRLLEQFNSVESGVSTEKAMAVAASDPHINIE